MKLLIRSLLLICFSSLSAVDYSIVFIHVGPKIPNYFFDALIQARKFNDADHAEIIALVEKRALCDEHYDKARDYHIRFEFCDDLQKSEEHIRFNQLSTLDRQSMSGFWFYTTERFFYLDELMQQYNLNTVFHLESDNMLYADIGEMLPLFTQYYSNIAAVFDCDYRCIPSFMYFAWSTSLRKLVTHLARSASKGDFDMFAIAKFWQQSTSDVIDSLPIIMPAYVTKHGLRNDMGKTTKYPERYTQHCVELKSIFDGAAIGQYLGGTSPDAGGVKPGFVNETCLFNPSKVRIEWFIDDKQRKVPYVQFEGVNYRINNLHIHSKNLKVFAS